MELIFDFGFNFDLIRMREQLLELQKFFNDFKLIDFNFSNDFGFIVFSVNDLKLQVFSNGKVCVVSFNLNKNELKDFMNEFYYYFLKNFKVSFEGL